MYPSIPAFKIYLLLGRSTFSVTFFPDLEINTQPMSFWSRRRVHASKNFRRSVTLTPRHPVKLSARNLGHSSIIVKSPSAKNIDQEPDQSTAKVRLTREPRLRDLQYLDGPACSNPQCCLITNAGLVQVQALYTAGYTVHVI